MLRAVAKVKLFYLCCKRFNRYINTAKLLSLEHPHLLQIIITEDICLLQLYYWVCGAQLPFVIRDSSNEKNYLGTKIINVKRNANYWK